jgi:predicted component of type VI protein secretion system
VAEVAGLGVDSQPVYTPRLQLQSVGELEARVHAERAGVPFLVFRDGTGRQQVVALPADRDRVAVGRRPERGIHLEWDREVSRVHALLEHVAGAWTIVDDGLSRNGTFINHVHVVGRRRLQDGDVIRCGSVLLEFHDPRDRADEPTLKAKDGGAPAARLSPAQRRVLVELCRPLAGNARGVPATNKEIAARLDLSVDAVKTQLRRAAEVLGVDRLPQNEKRITLAWKAMEAGAITEPELRVGH